MDKETEIDHLCAQAGCSDKIAKIHSAQYVHRNWNPHPSEDFVRWWKNHPDCGNGIDAKRACNCRRYMDEFIDARSTGIAPEKWWEEP